MLIIRLRYFFLYLCCITGFLRVFSQDPELFFSQHEFSVCRGDIATVYITITGPPNYNIEFLFNGTDTIPAGSTSSTFPLDLFEPGIYKVIKFSNGFSGITNVHDSIVVEEYPAPDLYFTGGGLVCNDGELTPLTAHFTGEPPFTLIYLINNQSDTIVVNGLTHEFISDQPIFIETRSLEDNNCGIDIVVYAYWEMLTVTSPVIYGDTVFCELDSAVYSSDPDDFLREWLISGGAEYWAGADEAGSLLSVTWTEPGTHQVQLRLVDSNNLCSSQWASLNITVYDRPFARVSIDTVLCFELDESLHVEISAGPDEIISWPELGITGTSVEFYDGGTFSYILSNEFGCADTGWVMVENNCTWNLFVPEAFTPNNDGINDVLELFGLYDELEFTVYSPSGIVLFKANEESDPWDGTKNGNDIPEGSYYWHAIFRGYNGLPRKKTGIVTVIR